MSEPMERARIFVVEDSDEDVRLIQAAFQEHSVDADLRFAKDGETALRELNSSEETQTPDLIVLDLELPGVSGLAVLRSLRGGRFRNVPVMVFTSSESLIERDQAMELGVSAYMNKPIDLNEYLAIGKTVKRLISPEQSSTAKDQPARRLSARR